MDLTDAPPGLAAPSDPALVAAARNGDKAAFTALVGRHQSLLARVCGRMLDDATLAEDAAQEAILGALLNLDRLREPARFGPWLAGIGANICRRWLRRQARDNWSWEGLHGGRRIDQVPDPAATPSECAEAAELAGIVRRAVDGLPTGQRDAVLLFYVAGLPHREVAALLGTRSSAVKTRLHKARSSLRRDLSGLREELAVNETKDVAMVVSDVIVAPAEDAAPERHVVVLDEVGGDRRLPIWLGAQEATGLALALTETSLPRPGPYHLAATAVAAAGGAVRQVRITRLEGRTFYAAVVVDGPSGLVEIDARPSDALNLAMLVGAPVVADAAVLQAHSEPDTPTEQAAHAHAIADRALTRWRDEQARWRP